MGNEIEKAIEYFKSLLRGFEDKVNESYWGKVHNATTREMISMALAALERQGEAETLHTLDDWADDDGDVLWWTFPVEEPPYVGSPLDVDFPNYHKYWSRLPSNPVIEKWHKELEE